MSIVFLEVSAAEHRDICNSLKFRVRKDNLTPEEHSRITMLYERLVKIEPQKKCAHCGSTETYIYKGYPRWHNVNGKTYCHKCYSRQSRRETSTMAS